MAIQSEFSKKYIVDMEAKLPLIVDAFCNVFGENFRRQINNRLENINFTFSGSNYNLYYVVAFDLSRDVTELELSQLLDRAEEYNRKNRNILSEDNFIFYIANMSDIPFAYKKEMQKENIKSKDLLMLGRCSLIPSLNHLKLYKAVQYNVGRLTDKAMVHEIVHAMSATMTDISEGLHYINSGFSSSQEAGGSVYMSNEDFEKEEVMVMFNEVVTEYINLQICKNLESNGVSLMNTKGYYRSVYNKSLFILEPLFENIKSTLVEAYIHNDIERLERLIGKDKLEELKQLNAKVINNANLGKYDFVSGGEYEKMVDSLNNMDTTKNEDLELLKKTKTLVDEIVQNLENNQ